MAQMNNKYVRSLSKLMEAGFGDEKAILAMTMDDILALPGISVAEIVMINGIQKAVKANKVITFLGGGDPVQIARGIMVNHFGSIITREPIKLPPDGYLDIDPEKDWNFAGGDCRTVKEFQEKYPPAKKKEKERER